MNYDTMINQNIPNILIVDDVAANLKVLGDMLKADGYKVRPVPNGSLALQVAEKEKPDLILLDIMMPDMDGYEVCRRLKEHKTLNDIPVIFISALNDTNDIVKALKTGGVDYITKPFQSEEVSTRIATHLKIRQQNQELQKHLADKDRFISILAHDLKNPFNALLGLSDLLLKNIREYDLDRIESFMSIIHNTAESTYSLLESLLIWARTQSGKIPYDPQNLNFNSLSFDVAAVLKLTANNKNISINLLNTEELNVIADNNMLRAILRNLISNAIKFTPNGGRIDVHAIQTDLQTTISVSDNGIGMTGETINKLFDITQTHSTPGTEKETGTGLGLLLCKELVNKHNGAIWVESETGKGSSFKFSIPAMQ